jgi:hypothetical protein
LLLLHMMMSVGAGVVVADDVDEDGDVCFL